MKYIRSPAARLMQRFSMKSRQLLRAGKRGPRRLSPSLPHRGPGGEPRTRHRGGVVPPGAVVRVAEVLPAVVLRLPEPVQVLLVPRIPAEHTGRRLSPSLPHRGPGGEPRTRHRGGVVPPGARPTHRGQGARRQGRPDLRLGHRRRLGRGVRPVGSAMPWFRSQ